MKFTLMKIWGDYIGKPEFYSPHFNITINLDWPTCEMLEIHKKYSLLYIIYLAYYYLLGISYDYEEINSKIYLVRKWLFFRKTFSNKELKYYDRQD